MYIHDLPTGTPADTWLVPMDDGTQNYKVPFTAFFPPLETVTDWNTEYDETRRVRFLSAYNATNAPASSAHIMGIELNRSATQRVQIVSRSNSSSWLIYQRHYNGSSGWSDWKAVTMAS